MLGRTPISIPIWCCPEQPDARILAYVGSPVWAKIATFDVDKQGSLWISDWVETLYILR